MKATIRNIEPFDVSLGTNITFSWNGNQIYKVRCIIRNNETGVTVYDNKVDTMKPEYPLPPNSGLVNGGYYVCYITVLDIDGNESELQSIGMPFYCFTTPTFKLSLENESVVKASSYAIALNYSQSEKEILNSYNITLYSYQKTVLQSSGNVFDTSDLSFIISGLENGKQYYLRATGSTLHGMQLDTGYILINVSYTQAQVFTTLELHNRSDIGALEVRSNIASSEAIPKYEPVYIDNKYIDLLNNEITFNSGFLIEGDFSVKFILQCPKINSTILQCTNSDNTLNFKCNYREGSFSDSNGRKCFIELIAESPTISCVYHSNYLFIPYSTEFISIRIRRKGCFYDIKGLLIDASTVDPSIINSGLINYPSNSYTHTFDCGFIDTPASSYTKTIDLGTL